MLSDNTQLYEDEFTEKEFETVRLHHKTSESNEINWTKMDSAWRDEDGILCVKYSNGNWWHYNEKGEWW